MLAFSGGGPSRLVSGHGYLESPRSRNLIAFQDKNWEHPTETDPKPEDCPHCLNRGGTLGQCGYMTGNTAQMEKWVRDYNFPKNTFGDPMPPNIQARYKEGDIIEISVLVTTHHKGHFVFSGCAVEKETFGQRAPSAQCFEDHRLEFVEDVLYGGHKDENYPERAYIRPAGGADWVSGAPDLQPVLGARYIFRMKLPIGLHGDIVMLQWYYLTANSCKHVGYDKYDWPEAWGSDVKLYPGLPDCGVVPPDGAGVPEQFWNCAEVAIEYDSKIDHPPTRAPTVPETELEEEEKEVVGETNTAATAANAAEEYILCGNAKTNYYQATTDCAGYVYCVAGSAGNEYPCGNGLLYDEKAQACKWEADVTCGSSTGTSNESAESLIGRPTSTPTPPRPTNIPTPPPPTPKPTSNPLFQWTKVEPEHGKTMIGYFASWQWYDRNKVAAPINMDFSKVTRVNFAFFQITTSGDIFGTDSWADPITLFGPFDWMAAKGEGAQYCSWDEPGEQPSCSAHHYKEGLIYLAHTAGSEVYPSIGGWSLSDPFPAMAASSTSRKKFTSECVELIKSYNFDGIDLDWEYPGYEDHSGTPEDTVSFNLLLDDLRAALDKLGDETGRFYGITAALPCGPSIIDNIDIQHASTKLTELNLMTYDFHGSWNAKTGINAPLFDQEDSPQFSVHGCVLNWLAGGAPHEKINIGFPFYGRSFNGATGLYEPHKGSDTSLWTDDEGVPQYYNILKKMSSLTSVRDDRTSTQYAYTGNSFVSYDDERAICDKTAYAIDNSLNGYIIWELSGDLKEDLSTPLLDAANTKLRHPDKDCNSEEFADAIVADNPQGGSQESQNLVWYYPLYDRQQCIADGNEPSWMKTSDLFNSESDCCEKFFGWVESCISAAAADDTTTTTQPSVPVTKSTTTVAEPIVTVTESTATTTTTTTTTTTKQTTTEPPIVTEPPILTEPTVSITDQTTTPATMSNGDNSGEATSPPLDDGFYPMFRSNGRVTTCRNRGKPPNWMKAADLKTSRESCCKAYAFPWQVTDCMGLTESNVQIVQNGYFPDFAQQSCVTDSPLSNWMTLDYYRETMHQCCDDFFSTGAAFAYCKFKGR